MLKMKVEELKRRLEEEGCNPLNYAVGLHGMADDAYRLVEVAGVWSVFYTERGSDSAPIFKGTDEAQACAFFLKHIMSLPNHHCIARFHTKEKVEILRAKLSAHGVSSYEDVIPYSQNVPLYRVFVTGKAIFPAKEILGNVPVLD
jgi:hypothetical protein